MAELRRGSLLMTGRGRPRGCGNELSQVLGPLAVRDNKFVSLGVAPWGNELDLVETHSPPCARAAVHPERSPQGRSPFVQLPPRGERLLGNNVQLKQPFRQSTCQENADKSTGAGCNDSGGGR